MSKYPSGNKIKKKHSETRAYATAQDNVINSSFNEMKLAALFLFYHIQMANTRETLSSVPGAWYKR